MVWDDRDPTEPPDAEDFIMSIDFRTEAYKQMREEAAEDLERQVREGDATQKEVYKMLVDANILTRQMNIHIKSLYQNFMAGALILMIMAGNLLWDFYQTGTFEFGLWGAYALLVGLVGMKMTPSGTLKATLWDMYEALYDGVRGVFR